MLASILTWHRPRQCRFRERELRGGDLVRLVGRGGKAGEISKWMRGPATGVTGREDRREGHLPVGVGFLHPTEIVLIGDTRLYSESGPSRSQCQGTRRSPRVRTVDRRREYGERHGEWYALGRSGRPAEAGDVAADHAALRKDVRSVEPTGKGAGVSSGMTVQLSVASLLSPLHPSKCSMATLAPRRIMSRRLVWRGSSPSRDAAPRTRRGDPWRLLCRLAWRLITGQQKAWPNVVPGEAAIL